MAMHEMKQSQNPAVWLDWWW